MNPLPADPYRPQFHLTPSAGWINDPNGLVFDGKLWHACYQYFNPAEVDGMQWGHATSPDIVHWEEHAPLLAPDAHGQIWSGSSVMDGNRLVALFTYWNPAEEGRQSQGMAESPDGFHFTKHPANPVIPQLRYLVGFGDVKAFRDPKVFWHAETELWVMIVAGGKVRFFTSRDLVEWIFVSDLEGYDTECPDLFPLELAGQTHWVLSGGGRWYLLGDFDGEIFTPRGERHTFGHGPDFYATQSFAHAPGGRIVAQSWVFGWGYESGPGPGATIRNPFPTSWAGGCQTVPLELTLASEGGVPGIRTNPVEEFKALREAETSPEEAGLAWDAEITLRCPKGNASWSLRLAKGGKYPVTLTVDWAKQQLSLIREDPDGNTVASYATATEAPFQPGEHGEVTLRILRDHVCLEIFAQGGAVVLSAFILADPELPGFTCTWGEAVELSSRRVWKMGKAIKHRGIGETAGSH